MEVQLNFKDAFALFVLIIPMFLYPFGVAIRDIKKFLDFNLALETFRDELPDQEISLAETYQP